MYENLDIACLARVGADNVVGADRARFNGVYDAIHDYVREHSDIIIGGDEAIKLWCADTNNDKILTEKKGESKRFALFAKDAKKTTVQLSDIIYEIDHVGMCNTYAVMSPTSVPPMYNIYVDTRLVATIRQLTTPSSLNNLIKSINIKGLHVIPEELMSIYILRKLSNAALVDKWVEFLDIEKKMRTVTLSKYERLVEREGTAPKIDRQTHKAILDAIANIFNCRNGGGTNLVGVAIGCCAISPSSIESARLQIIACHPINEIREQIVNAAAMASKKFAVLGSITSPHIPDEPYLNRLTISYTYNGINVSVADIYNAGEYEHIQLANRSHMYKDVEVKGMSWSLPRGIPIAAPAVIARFALIDLWILSFLRDIPNINPASLVTASSARIQLYKDMGDVLDLRSVESHQYNYIGNLLRDTQMNRKKKTYTPPYYPSVRNHK